MHQPIIIVLGVLNAIGVYIGRYLRLNSWDILNPSALLKNVVASLNVFSLEFIILFSVVFIGLIWAYDKFFEK